MLHNLLSKLFVAGKDVEKHISWTKIGTLVVSVSAALLEANVCPNYVSTLKVIISIGTGVGLIGARDALVK